MLNRVSTVWRRAASLRSEEGEAGLRTLVSELERAYPSAAACLAEEPPALCVHLRYPRHLRRRLRSTNLLERSLGEVQRRVRVIGRFPGERSSQPLLGGARPGHRGARRLGLSDVDGKEIQRLRAQRQTDRADVALSA